MRWRGAEVGSVLVSLWVWGELCNVSGKGGCLKARGVWEPCHAVISVKNAPCSFCSQHWSRGPAAAWHRGTDVPLSG